MRCAAFAGSYSADYKGAVLGCAFGVEGAFFAGDALNDKARVFIYKDCH
jgi:uncharacterized Ntn-hydrolase superfamily protein